MPLFASRDFIYDADARPCVCPAGKSLYRTGARNVTNGYVGAHFRGAKRDGGPCALRAQCLRKPETSVVRTVAFLRGREDAATETHTMRMQQRLDTPEGREQYGQRFATVEPVFANLRYNKRLDRFTLRGRTKVHGQWLLFCVVRDLHHRCVEVFSTTSTLGFSCSRIKQREHTANRLTIATHCCAAWSLLLTDLHPLDPVEFGGLVARHMIQVPSELQTHPHIRRGPEELCETPRRVRRHAAPSVHDFTDALVSAHECRQRVPAVSAPSG